MRSLDRKPSNVGIAELEPRQKVFSEIQLGLTYGYMNVLLSPIHIICR
jgi:hypothetical protein